MRMKIFSAVFNLVPLGAGALPLHITPGDLGSYKIDVDVLFDGQSRRFQLDTGANNSMVIPDEQTNTYPTLRKAEIRGAAGTPLECDVFQPAAIQMDSFVVTAPIFRRCDLGEHSFNNLGLDIFEKKILELQFSTKTLKILDQVSADATPLPLQRLSKGHLLIPVQIGSKKQKALLDTGAQLTSIDQSFVDTHPESFQLIKSVTSGRDITGRPVSMNIYDLTELNVGNIVFKNVRVTAFDFKTMGPYLDQDTVMFLGSNVLIQADWILDLNNNQWGVKQL